MQGEEQQPPASGEATALGIARGCDSLQVGLFGDPHRGGFFCPFPPPAAPAVPGTAPSSPEVSVPLPCEKRLPLQMVVKVNEEFMQSYIQIRLNLLAGNNKLPT